MTSALLIQTRKEVRALLPWTIGVAITSLVLGLLATQDSALLSFRHNPGGLFIMAYALGVLSLAALSIGQELTHETLAALLVQPLDRVKVLGLKLVVLAIPLIGLGMIAEAVFPQGYLPDARRLFIWGPVAAGFGLVPLLTVLTRRPLGGVVFAITIPGLFLLVGTRIYPLQDPALTFTWYCTLAACAIGLAALFVQFRRLELAGGRQQVSASPAIVRTALPLADYVPTVRRSWVWLLIKKEFRLQQMTFAVSGLYVLAAGAILILAQSPAYVGPSFGSIATIYAYFIPLIAGATSSAEERHMGTLAGQILAPRNMRLQWAIKAALTISIAVALAIGLPLLVMALDRPVDPFRTEADFSISIALLCAAAMYVSSLSSNSLWALLGCFPVLGLGAMVAVAGRQYLWRLVFAWLPYRQDGDWPFIIRAMQAKEPWVKEWWAARLAASRDLQFSLQTIETSLTLGLGLLVLFFAARNHRAIDRNFRTVTFQVTILLLVAIVAATGYAFLSRVTWEWH